MNRTIKLLFISHDATRTGAPILLLNLADLLLSNGNFSIDFLLKRGGILEGEFSSRGKVYIASGTGQSLSNRVKKKLGLDKPFLIDHIDFSQYDMLLSNTITNGDILEYVRQRFHGLIVSYIHELEMATEFFTSKEDVKKLVQSTSLFAVPSEAVQKHLTINIGIEENKIFRLNYFIKAKPVTATTISRPGKHFVVGALGTTDWRKSPDLFIQTAVAVFKEKPGAGIHFLWQGDSFSETDKSRLLYDVRKAGLDDRITFRHGSANVEDFYNSIDVFFLTSREDPFPLVVLESAAYKIPAICFNGTGGACEFIRYGKGGFIVPYLECQTAAEKVLEYYSDPKLLQTHGENARQYLQIHYQDHQVIINQLNELISKAQQPATL